MAEWTVLRDMPLERFLRQKKCQKWRIPILVRCGGVKVFHKGTEVRLKDEKTRLKAFDKVRLLEPTPERCLQALRKEAEKNSRDYAFVPGTGDYGKRMGKLMEARPETIRINHPLIDSLSDFISALEESLLITHPIRNVIVASHAHPEGRLVMAIRFLGKKEITYKDLKDAVKSKSIQLDDNLFLPRPADNEGVMIPAQFLFRGCRIGSQPEYMKKLKEALGNKIAVVAPKHFHHVDQLKNPPGYLEYMGYSFVVTKPEKLKNKTAVIKAFIAADPDHERIDGQPVPEKLWSEWIPSKPNVPGERPFKNMVILPVIKTKENVPRRFRYRIRPLLDEEGWIDLPKDTGDDADRKAAVRSALEKLDRYKDPHFPEYKRYGYKSMGEFMDGWKWDFVYDKSSKRLYYNAKRHEYRLMQPITEIRSNELVLNFYPTTKKGKVIELLKVSDDRFFATF